MNRRWRRLVLMATAALLVMFLVVIGVVVWLHQSGRLATLSQDLLQRLSGQDVTIDTIEFPSWNTVVFTNVRLQQHVPGWRLTVACPRLEAHYGLTGLLNQQVDHLHLRQPRIELSRSHDTSPPWPSAPSPDSRAVAVLPLKRLTMQHGTVHVRWQNQAYTLHQLEASLQPQSNRQLQIKASGSLGGSATTLQVVGHTRLGDPQPTGRLHLTADAVSLPLLAEAVSQALPPAWEITQGALDVEAELDIEPQTLRGTITTRMEQVTGKAQGLAIHRAALSTTATLEANYAQRTLHLEGEASLQVAKVRRAPDIVLTNLTLTAPWRLSYTPDHWQVTATPALRSQAVAVGTLVQVSRLSLTMPVQAQHNTTRGLQIQGTSEFKAQSIDLRPGDQTGASLRITDLHGRLPVRASATRLELAEAHVQTQAWHRQTADETQLLAALVLQGSSSVDLQRQRLTWREVTATLPQLGRISGSGAWHWPSHTVHDLQVQLAPRAVEALWNHLQDLLPASYRGWQVAGHTDLQLRAARLSLRPPWRLPGLGITWQVRDGAFSSPDSTYAGEHLTGTVEATATFDAAAGQHTLQGTLTLNPFAVLIGSMFPAIEENRITSVVTFSNVYRVSDERLQIYLAGQFRHLGVLTLQGAVHRPLETPRYDLQLHLRNVRAARVWKTLMDDSVRFPTLSQATVQGTVNATLRVHGQSTNLLLQGTLDLTDGRFDTATVALRGVSLLLPLQMRYPLPKTAPQTTALPGDAYGRLSIATLQIGDVEVGRLTTRLALRSDNVMFQRGVSLALWGGELVLDHITARHMLQPHRLLTLRARLRDLDLQRLSRGTTKLPLAGMVNGDFPRLQIRGDRLDTQGSLTIAIAGGTIRVFNVQGQHLLSTLPTLRCSLTTEQPISLRRLTNIYPIGDIGGTVHFSVTDLTLTAGEPAAFALAFAVREKGGESRDITLRALNNLLFTTGSAKVASGLIGETYRLPYKRFGADVTLRHDTLRLRGKYRDSKGREYFMRAPALGGGVSIINRVPENGIPFRDFLQRLKATVLEAPEVKVK